MDNEFIRRLRYIAADIGMLPAHAVRLCEKMPREPESVLLRNVHFRPEFWVKSSEEVKLIEQYEAA